MRGELPENRVSITPVVDGLIKHSHFHSRHGTVSLLKGSTIIIFLDIHATFDSVDRSALTLFVEKLSD